MSEGVFTLSEAIQELQLVGSILSYSCRSFRIHPTSGLGFTSVFEYLHNPILSHPIKTIAHQGD
jgi:hypothetical protein